MTVAFRHRRRVLPLRSGDSALTSSSRISTSLPDNVFRKSKRPVSGIITSLNARLLTEEGKRRLFPQNCIGQLPYRALHRLPSQTVSGAEAIGGSGAWSPLAGALP